MNKKLKNPDLTRFGFYLYPKVYRNTMGFDKAHGLLFLDSRGRIEDSVAKEIGMVRLLNSSSAVLYAINPVDGKYPNASELLKSLALGSVAKQRLITKDELRREFLDQCAQCNIVIDLLDKAVRLGVNRDGYVVYESKSGRYIVDEKGESHRHLPSEQLLYAVSDSGEMVESKIEYCLESLFKFHLNVNEDKLEFIDAGDFNNFVQTVVRRPPTSLPKMGDYDPISFYGESEIVSLGAKTAQIIDVLERLEAQLMLNFDFDDDEAFEQYFHHIYNRSLPATDHGFKPNLPAPLLIMLLKLMSFNLIDEPHIYSPSVGNTALLAGLVKLSESGAKITACERFADKQSIFNDFLHEAMVGDIEVVGSASVQDFDGSISYLPLGDEASAVLIPDSDTHTYKKSLVSMLDLLSRRTTNGRSIFISPVDSEGSLGRLDDDSTMFIRYLYQNYQNVLIFDCNQVLSSPTRNTCEYRIYVIGEHIEDYSLLNNEDLAELILNPKIQTVDSPEDFYLICAKYASEIAAVEISSVDLMDNLMDIMEDEEDSPSTPSLEKAPSDSSDHSETQAQDQTQPQSEDDSDTASSNSDEAIDNKPVSDADATESEDDADATAGTDSKGTSSDSASGGGRAKSLTNKLIPDSSVVHGDEAANSANQPADANDDSQVALDTPENENSVIIIGGDEDSPADGDDLVSDEPDFDDEHNFEEPSDPSFDFDEPDDVQSKVESQSKGSGLSR